MTPDVALAASARDWPDRIHRHVLDHGGGRVIGRVMTAEQALDGGFNVLLIDDVCSFLSPGLVTLVRANGAEIVGVFSPDDGSDAKRRLVECGVSDVIETEAAPSEFLDTIRAALDHRRSAPVPSESPTRAGLLVGVGGVTPGVGATEVAIGLATALSRELTTWLVDADTRWPSVAQRLDLPVHPNVRTAVDAVVHRSGDIESSVHHVGDLGVIGGIADWRDPAPLGTSDLTMLLDRVTMRAAVTVVDLGAIDSQPPSLLARFDELVAVGFGDPVGVSRLIVALDRLPETADVLAVVNQAPKGRFHQSEIRRGMEMAAQTPPLLVVPRDHQLAGKVWEGKTSRRSAFGRVMRRMADLISQKVEA